MLIKKKISVGIDIGSNMIKIIGIIRKKEKISIEFINSIDLYHNKTTKISEDLKENQLVPLTGVVNSADLYHNKKMGKSKNLKGTQLVPLTSNINSIDLYHNKKMENPEDSKDTQLVSLIREMTNGLKKFRVSKINVSISSINAIVRIFEMPLIFGDDLKSAIKWKVNNALPYASQDIEFDYQILNKNEDNTSQEVLVGIVPSSEMKRILDIFSSINLDPDLVDIDSLAVYHCFWSLYNNSKNKTVALFNIGAEKTSIIIVNPKQNPYFTSLNLGGNTITRDIMKNLHTSFLNAEHIKTGTYSHFSSQIDSSEKIETIDTKKYYNFLKYKLSLELKRSELYFQTQHGEDQIEDIFITGGGAKSDNYWNPLKEDIIINNTKNKNFDDIGPFFTTALGLALRD